MTKRNPLLVVALTFVTFTLYAYYWLYKTTAELKEEGERDDLHPVLDVVLAALTFGLWGLWAGYRNARITHELFEELGEKHTDRSLAVGLFGAGSFITGWSWLIAMGLLQDDYNRLVDEYDAADRFIADELYERRRAPVHTRVDVERPEPPRTGSEETSSAPFFESTAPAPRVF